MSAIGNVLAWPFRNPEERRLRWGWRFFIPVFLSIVLLFVGGLAAAPLIPFLETLTPEFPEISGYLGTMAARTLVVVVFLVLWARFVDRRRISDYGFHVNREWFIHLVGGMLIGLSIPTAMLILTPALGWATVTDVASIGPAFVLAFLVGIFAAFLNGFWEETLYRGIALKNAAEGIRSMRLSPWMAVLGAWMLVSLAFALFHVLLGAGFSTSLYYVVGALSIGLVYVLTGELAFPIGYHAMYNFFTAVAFTTDPLPGDPTLVSLEVADSAPQLFLGEVALLEVTVIASAMLLMLLWVRWRKGNLKIETGIAEWTPRGAQKPHGSGQVR